MTTTIVVCFANNKMRNYVKKNRGGTDWQLSSPDVCRQRCQLWTPKCSAECPWSLFLFSFGLLCMKQTKAHETQHSRHQH